MPVDVIDDTYIDSLMIKILIFKLGIMLEHQNTKTFLLKITLQTGLKKFL